MLKIALITLLSLPLFAGFFPKTMHTSIKSVHGNDIVLQQAFPINGMSGVVIHKYGNDLNAITSRIAQTASNGTATLVSAGAIHHPALPTIKTPVQNGDKVIGGYMYQNVLVLAPDAATYTDITKMYHKKWIHPDLFALYLSVQGDGKPTKENLLAFAKKYQIGLVLIVRKKTAVLMDPISGKIISQKAMTNLPAQGNFPFYMRFKEIDTGWFGDGSIGNYYQTVGAL